MLAEDKDKDEEKADNEEEAEDEDAQANEDDADEGVDDDYADTYFDNGENFLDPDDDALEESAVFWSELIRKLAARDRRGMTHKLQSATVNVHGHEDCFRYVCVCTMIDLLCELLDECTVRIACWQRFRNNTISVVMKKYKHALFLFFTKAFVLHGKYLPAAVV